MNNYLVKFEDKNKNTLALMEVGTYTAFKAVELALQDVLLILGDEDFSGCNHAHTVTVEMLEDCGLRTPKSQPQVQLFYFNDAEDDRVPYVIFPSGVVMFKEKGQWVRSRLRASEVKSNFEFEGWIAPPCQETI